MSLRPAHPGVDVSLLRHVCFRFNFTSLAVFVDVLGLPADYVVLALIVVTPVILFALQRWWVFPRSERVVAVDQKANAS